LRPGAGSDNWTQIVAPALAALAGGARAKFIRNGSPVVRAEFSDELQDRLILANGESAFEQTRMTCSSELGRDVVNARRRSLRRTRTLHGQLAIDMGRSKSVPLSQNSDLGTEEETAESANPIISALEKYRTINRRETELKNRRKSGKKIIEKMRKERFEMES
jgi:hypothetical protein